jgi:hypothetical protein
MGSNGVDRRREKVRKEAERKLTLSSSLTFGIVDVAAFRVVFFGAGVARAFLLLRDEVVGGGMALSVGSALTFVRVDREEDGSSTGAAAGVASTSFFELAVVVRFVRRGMALAGGAVAREGVSEPEKAGGVGTRFERVGLEVGTTASSTAAGVLTVVRVRRVGRRLLLVDDSVDGSAAAGVAAEAFVRVRVGLVSMIVSSTEGRGVEVGSALIGIFRVLVNLGLSEDSATSGFEEDAFEEVAATRPRRTGGRVMTGSSADRVRLRVALIGGWGFGLISTAGSSMASSSSLDIS